MRIALIWAMTNNRVIGRDNRLPWRLPDDMRHFMSTTLGHPVVMGRRTFESMNKPLPGRANIVLTGRPDYAGQGISVAADFRAGLAIAENRCREDGKNTTFVIGGARVYEAALPIADRLIVTRIDADIDGDTWFPAVDWSDWQATSSASHDTDAAHAYPFSITAYKRR